MKILIADDDQIFITLVSDILSGSGDEVHTAANGREAWDLLEANGADIAVLDVNMPEMDGTELLARIRADERFAALPVLVLATGFVAEDLVSQYDSAITDYLPKPFEVNDLLDKVREMTAR
jgi:CheY-like chemotaxis protein